MPCRLPALPRDARQEQRQTENRPLAYWVVNNEGDKFLQIQDSVARPEMWPFQSRGKGYFICYNVEVKHYCFTCCLFASKMTVSIIIL